MLFKWRLFYHPLVFLFTQVLYFRNKIVLKSKCVYLNTSFYYSCLYLTEESVLFTASILWECRLCQPHDSAARDESLTSDPYLELSVIDMKRRELIWFRGDKKNIVSSSNIPTSEFPCPLVLETRGAASN